MEGLFQPMHLVVLFFLLLATAVSAKEIVLTHDLHHLRFGPVREWSDFPEKAEGASLSLKFQAEKNAYPESARFMDDMMGRLR